MKTVLCFTAIIFLLRAIAIQVEKEQQIGHSINKPVTINWNGLQQFRNRTGATFGEAQLRSLIGILNNASTLYASDIASNIKYIKTNMDASFGNSTHQYSVIIEGAPGRRDFGNATVYCEGGTNYAFLGWGINLKYPYWTYLVYKVSSPTATYTYVNNQLGRGSGLSADYGDYIQIIIDSVDGHYACDCTSTQQISQILENTFFNKWNVVCEQETGEIFSYVAIYNATWITMKPEACTYFMYVVK